VSNTWVRQVESIQVDKIKIGVIDQVDVRLAVALDDKSGATVPSP
jgi:hypothetical protein